MTYSDLRYARPTWWGPIKHVPIPAKAAHKRKYRRRR